MRRRLVNSALTFLITAFVLVFVAHLILARSQTKKRDDSLAYKLASGPYTVETIDTSIHDAKRNKDLPIRILTPKSGGPFPVIVFSHGAGGSGKNYFGLTGFWASHGYAVIQPTHSDSLSLRRENGEPMPAGPRELVEEYRFNYDDWINRVRDIDLVTDSLNELE